VFLKVTFFLFCRDAVDCLPESSTCANMLYLPNYTR